MHDDHNAVVSPRRRLLTAARAACCEPASDRCFRIGGSRLGIRGQVHARGAGGELLTSLFTTPCSVPRDAIEAAQQAAYAR